MRWNWQESNSILPWSSIHISTLSGNRYVFIFWNTCALWNIYFWVVWQRRVVSRNLLKVRYLLPVRQGVPEDFGLKWTSKKKKKDINCAAKETKKCIASFSIEATNFRCNISGCEFQTTEAHQIFGKLENSCCSL